MPIVPMYRFGDFSPSQCPKPPQWNCCRVKSLRALTKALHPWRDGVLRSNPLTIPTPAKQVYASGPLDYFPAANFLPIVYRPFAGVSLRQTVPLLH